jgi:hypothetical protein
MFPAETLGPFQSIDCPLSCGLPVVQCRRPDRGTFFVRVDVGLVHFLDSLLAKRSEFGSGHWPIEFVLADIGSVMSKQLVFRVDHDALRCLCARVFAAIALSRDLRSRFSSTCSTRRDSIYESISLLRTLMDRLTRYALMAPEANTRRIVRGDMLK